MQIIHSADDDQALSDESIFSQQQYILFCMLRCFKLMLDISPPFLYLMIFYL